MISRHKTTSAHPQQAVPLFPRHTPLACFLSRAKCLPVCFLLSFLLHCTLTSLVSFLPSLLLTQLHEAPTRRGYTENTKYGRRVSADIAPLLPMATTTTAIAFTAVIAAIFIDAAIAATINYIAIVAPTATANIVVTTTVVTTTPPVAVAPVASITTVAA